MSGTVLVEPKYEISSNNSLLYPARSIAHVENNRLPIKIFNANDFPVKVFAGTCVGMAETVEEKELSQEEIGVAKSGESKIPYSTFSTEWLNEIDLSNCDIAPGERQRLLELLINGIQ